MFPIFNYLLYFLFKNNFNLNKLYLFIYAIFLSLFLAVIKLHLYEDDFFGYFEHYQSLINNNEVPYYSEGKELVLTAIMLGIGAFKINEIVYFSFVIKIITFATLLGFLRNYKSNINKYNSYIFVLAVTSPNFIIYTDSFIRQSISLVFLLLCIISDLHKKLFFYAISVFTHLSTLIYLPILHINIRFSLMFIALILSYLVSGVDYEIFSNVADFFGMSDKLYFIDQMYALGAIDTRPSFTTFLPAILIIVVAKVSNKNLSEHDNKLINIFLYTIILGNLVAGIPFATSRVSMLVMAFTPILFILLRGRVQVVLSSIIYIYLWVRFALRENPTLELNYQYLVWPFGVS